MDRNEMNNWISWLKWIQYIEWNPDNTENFTLFPLQIANAIRIMCNDMVCIFDEVGCGKTLSAGIMAKTLIENKKVDVEKILVITTTTLRDTKSFQMEWKRIDKELGEKVKVCNHSASGLRKHENEKIGDLEIKKIWDLVIIDEAHEFFEERTQKREAIESLRANKVVFLTATPLRGNKENFELYKSLSKKILGDNDTFSCASVEYWDEYYDEYESEIISNKFDKIDNVFDNIMKVNADNLICAQFDPTFPVTRYFKDTVKYLDLHEKKEKAHRVIPEVWIADKTSESRKDILLKNIQIKLEKNKTSKFVIFVSRKADAENLKEYLIINSNLDENDVVSVFAENKGDLAKYATVDGTNLPKILIINYMIGEAGVNLPAYDHVIHWYISGDPARLEQRYGRIDRMTSKHEEIYSIFVEPVSWDTNYNNFIKAIEYTMRNLLTVLPARNVILNKNTLSRYKYAFEEKIEKRKEYLAKSESFLKFLREDYTEEKNSMIVCCFKDDEQESDQRVSPEGWKDFFKDIIRGYKDKLDQEDENGLGYQLIKLLERETREGEDRKKLKFADSFEAKIEDLERDSDKIFYLCGKKFDPSNLQTIGAQDDYDSKIGCASNIDGKDEYKMLREIIAFHDSVRRINYFIKNNSGFPDEVLHDFSKGMVKRFAEENITFAAQLIDELGEIAFEDDWKDGAYSGKIYGMFHKAVKG